MTRIIETAQKDRIRNSIYEDTGCDISARCLTCPLSMCKYDSPGEYKRYKRGIQDTVILTKIQQEGLTVRQTALEFSLNERMIYRIIAATHTPLRRILGA